MSDRFRTNLKGEMTTGKAVGLVVFVVIALALLPTLIISTNQGENATNNGTVFANQATVHPLIPLLLIFFVIGIVIGIVAYVVHEVRSE